MTTYFAVSLRGKLIGSSVRNLVNVQKSEFSFAKPKMCFNVLILYQDICLTKKSSGNATGSLIRSRKSSATMWVA